MNRFRQLVTVQNVIILVAAVMVVGGALLGYNKFHPTANNAENPTQLRAVDGSLVTDATMADVVQGNAVLDAALISDSQKADQVAKVDYFSDEHLVQTLENGPLYLDTTLVKDGSHTLRSVVTFKDGSVQEQTQIAMISNGEKGHGAGGYGNDDQHHHH